MTRSTLKRTLRRVYALLILVLGVSLFAKVADHVPGRAPKSGVVGDGRGAVKPSSPGRQGGFILSSRFADFTVMRFANDYSNPSCTSGLSLASFRGIIS